MIEQISRMRTDLAWIAVITIIIVTVNPLLKYVGLLPADVFKELGIFFPGLPQIVFGPLVAFLSVVLFMKTGLPHVFLGVSTLRALALGFIFPANIAHLGAGLAGIPASIVAMKIVKNSGKNKLNRLMPLLGGIYAGFYASGNYLTTILLGPAAQTSTIAGSPHLAIGVVIGSVVLGVLGGLGAYKLMRTLSARSLIRSGFV